MKTFTPEVNSAREFFEIAFDFTASLDVVREAISNAFDAKAKNISIAFTTKSEGGEDILYIALEDDGEGMDGANVKSFFDLGNSSRRDINGKPIPGYIGQKGHGTKTYFNSSRIEVETVKNNEKIIAVMDEPRKNLYNQTIPTYTIETFVCNDKPGTKILIKGYNNSRCDKFNHDNIVDYIKWKTKMGSIEKEFGISTNTHVKLKVKGVDKDDFEDLDFGHYFPADSKSPQVLISKHQTEAPGLYCKKIIKNGALKSSPQKKWEAIFSIEGSQIKYNYNKMLRRSGYTAPANSYIIGDRYGLWLCKDYVPIQQVNEWLGTKGNENTKFHAFLNCQDLRLTANRSSVDNTPPEILADLKEEVKKIYEEITSSKDWQDLAELESQAKGFNTAKAEENDYQRRKKRVNQARIADYQGIRLIEPRQESGVYTLYVQLQTIAKLKNKNIFPFVAIDYDTHQGYDVLVKENTALAIKDTVLKFVEFKCFKQRV